MEGGICIHPFDLALDFQDHDGPEKIEHHVSFSLVTYPPAIY